MTHRELAIEEATHSQTGDCNATHFRVVVLHRWQHLIGTNGQTISWSYSYTYSYSKHSIKLLIIPFKYCKFTCTRMYEDSRGAYSKLYSYEYCMYCTAVKCIRNKK